MIVFIYSLSVQHTRGVLFRSLVVVFKYNKGHQYYGLHFVKVYDTSHTEQQEAHLF